MNLTNVRTLTYLGNSVTFASGNDELYCVYSELWRAAGCSQTTDGRSGLTDSDKVVARVRSRHKRTFVKVAAILPRLYRARLISAVEAGVWLAAVLREDDDAKASRPQPVAVVPERAVLAPSIDVESLVQRVLQLEQQVRLLTMAITK